MEFIFIRINFNQCAWFSTRWGLVVAPCWTISRIATAFPRSGQRTHIASDERPTGFIGVTAGSLDDPSWFRPQMDFFVSDAQPWDQIDPAIPKYELYPPATKSAS